MATTKFLTSSLLALCATFGVAMNANKTNNATTKTNAEALTITKEASLKKNNVGNEIEDATKYILDKIITDGPSLITGAVTTYAKNMVINILKDYGIDFRDASIKYLERIENSLEEIKEKLNAIEKKQDIYQAQSILNNGLYKMFTEINFTIKDKVYGSLWELATLELEDKLSEEELEARRYEVYKALLKDYSLQANTLGLENTLVGYASTVADAILRPNQADPSKDIFYYYDLTLGQNDKWVGQQIKNRRAYIAYCTNMLLATVNLAEFDMHYRYEEKPAARATYDRELQTMADYVNAVGTKFQAELKRLDELEKKMKDDHITSYLPTNTEYSTRMATLTYNLNDREGDQSRQSLLRANKLGSSYRDSGMAYHPDQNLINNVVNDYKTYVGTYHLEDYSINKYLKDAGFYANNEDLFDSAAGIFYGDLKVNSMGLFYHDTELTSAYYNKEGNYVSTPIYKVNCYHNWLGAVTRSELVEKNFDYYLCFIRSDQKRLVGNFQASYFDRLTTDISRSLFYTDDIGYFVGYSDFFVQDCW